MTKYKERYEEGIEINFKDVPIYVISLAESTDRQEYIKKQLKDYSFEIVNAVNGRMIDENSIPSYIRKGTLNAGQIGCFMSHFNLWERILESNNKLPSVILEDDAQFAINLQDINRLPTDFDIIFIGHCAEKETDKVFNAGNGIEMQISVYPRCTHGYIISSKGAWKLTEIIKDNEYAMPVDEVLAHLISIGIIKCFSTYPQVVVQSNVPSTINI